MRVVAPDVHQLTGFPPNQINVYLVGDVLVDSGTASARRRVLRQLEGATLSAHVVTHAHPDHFGASHAICTTRGIPLWAGAHDVTAIETGAMQVPASPVAGALSRMPPPPAHPVDRALREGDEVAGFTVLEVPGHTPGHIALWREADRVLLCGDVFFHLGRVTKPPDFLTLDPERNRRSMQRLRALRPDLVLFGHGAPARRPVTHRHR
ncbi:MBL fold metallo-hydrolase [Herbiconiux sp. SYSU D00978]|uniref:MBL fold metallo-hydrolase n=1 Tax=Herbiconiux sp. SYSU D00978 TaxID=2812562 RepID=UPI001A960DBE|nr:MBL fold metallo-hydrolase [Herbiconiux sp. SYSU D00978]